MVNLHRPAWQYVGADPAVVTEAELRRYLRHASVLLASVEMPSGDLAQRAHVLRRARHWIAAVLLGVDQLLDAVPNEIDDRLTARVCPATIEPER